MSVFQFYKSYFYLIKYPFVLGTIWIIFADTCGRLSAYFGSRLVELISLNSINKFSILNIAIILIIISTILAIARSTFIEVPFLIDKKYIPYLRGKITKDLFLHIHKHAPSFFEQEMSGNISSKVKNIVYSFEDIYYTSFWLLYQPFLTVLTVVISILFVSFSLSIILTTLLVLFYIWIWHSSKEVMPFNKKYAQEQSLSIATVVDSISNADTVKNFARFSHEKKYLFHQLNKTAKAQRTALKKTRWIGLKQGTGRNIFQFVLCIIPLVYWYYDFISFANYIFIQSLIITVSYQTGNLSMDITHFLSSAATMQEALDLIYKPITLLDKSKLNLNVKKGEILIDNINFGYSSDKTIFKNFSLTIKPKTRLGLVGYSGSGKSSLIKLINRMYDIQKGSIFIDGQSIQKVSLKSLHQAIAYIPQEPSLLNRTIRENILYARPNATEEELIDAAKKAYCHDFIMQLPKGYDSKVGDRGVMLSGGVRQRIAIARAILKDAPILILDEATSALDSESETHIQKSLEYLMKDKTVIAIAHRLSTLKKMDQIIVLENGQITENGTHSDLMKNKKTYYQFYKMQSTIFIGE